MPDPNAPSRIDELIRAHGPDYERLVEDRRERERKRKREARKQQTLAQRARTRDRDRVRKQEARQRQTAKQREREKQREQSRDRRKIRPFMAIDGEGGGTDHLGRQNYLLMVASGITPGEERIRHGNGKPLSVIDCLEFLLSLPVEPILVGFGFGYDATQILRGIKPPTLRQIMNPRHDKNGPSYTYWGEYGIIYQQGQYLRVARIDRSGEKPGILKGSSRTVYETLGFFQCAFVKAIRNWNIGSEQERAIIATNKMQRDAFNQLTDEIIVYCKLECRHLAMLMTEFREVCAKAGISPKQWSGAGWLASDLLHRHGVPKRPLSSRETGDLAAQKPSKNPKPVQSRRPERDRQFEIAANSAYYGGRFEVSRIGPIAGPVYEYDLRSAYPAAMSDLPCPLHTRWEHKPRASRLPEDDLYLAKVSFSHPDGLWCGLPFRQSHRLFWPYQGTGWYWSPEIEAARRQLHADIVVRDLWIARRRCDCRSFDWVSDLYDQRRRLGRETRGYPLKLGLNSLYGKMAQRVGRAPYHDVVAAGLITAITRARLIEAISRNPQSVVMLATDAVFSTQPLALDIGEGLGQWEEKILPDLFIAQPGVYWSPSELKASVKSRGAPRSIIGDAAPRFHEVFADWFELMRRPEARETLLQERSIPSVQVIIRVFTGCRLALARGKPWLAGQWKGETRDISFEWTTKRDALRIELGEGCVKTFPLVLPILAESEGPEPANFERVIEVAAEDNTAEEINTLLEAMPDHLQFLPHE